MVVYSPNRKQKIFEVLSSQEKKKAAASGSHVLALSVRRGDRWPDGRCGSKRWAGVRLDFKWVIPCNSLG